MNTIDYNVLTGITVIAAARYFARARESFRDDQKNKCVCSNSLFHMHLKHYIGDEKWIMNGW